MNYFDVIYEKLTTMGVQDFVSIIAASIAILAALYARWSARASERANEIAIHTERLRIFKTIRHFQHEIESDGLDYPDAAHVQLIQGAELAEFYFGLNLAKALAKLVVSPVELTGIYHVSIHVLKAMEEHGNEVAEI